MGLRCVVLALAIVRGRAERQAERRKATCGAWCATANASTPCEVDTSITKCDGAFCTTTCGSWRASILIAGKPGEAMIFSCEQYIRAFAYPAGAEVCADECLVDEIKPNREGRRGP